MCFQCGGTHITTDMCFSFMEHILPMMGFSDVGEPISLGICVSQVEDHVSLGICVSQVGEHISLGICVSHVEEQSSLRICVFQLGNIFH